MQRLRSISDIGSIALGILVASCSNTDPPAGSVDATSGGQESAPTITGLAVEPNPNSTISCYVIWTTNVAADSEVDFGVGEYEFRIRDSASVKSHRVLVIGMHAEQTYQIRAISTNSAGAAEARGSFTTESLPAGVPVAKLTLSDDDAVQPGWTLTNISHGGNPAPPAVAVMYDEEGIPVWYYIDGTAPDTMGDVDTRLLPNSHVLMSAITTAPAVEVDLGGNVLWQGPLQPSAASARMSHHLDLLSNGHYLDVRNVASAEYGVTGTVMEEMSPELDVVWRWNIFDHLVPGQEATQDWCHGNSATVDLARDVVYLSCRNMGRVIKAQRTGDQSIIWQLGSGGDFVFDPPESGFADLHDPEIHDDGTILIYDNGGYSMQADAENRSRVVEYEIDEPDKVARLVWEFPGNFDVDVWYSSEWYTPIWGDADRLENGNILITAGTRDRGKQTHIFEVRRADGKVVWEIVLPLQNNAGFGSYRAQRIAPPLVERL